MGSRLTCVFKATVGLLVKKGRDATVEKLKQGDITDQKLGDVIVRESFKPMENMKLRGIGVSNSEILKDATIPCQSCGNMRK